MTIRVPAALRHRYAVVAAGAAALLVGAALLTTPRSSGVAAVWEAPAFQGSVLGDRALVATTSNKALDLVSGKTITLGSVTGGRRHVAGERLLVVGTDRVDGVRLDATQRWTWHAPDGTTSVTAIASGVTSTIVRTCDTRSAPSVCSYVGIGTGGTTSWTLPIPGDAGEPVVGEGGMLPRFAIVPVGRVARLLIDPESSRTILRNADRVWVAPDGSVVMEEKLDTGQCAVSGGASLDTLATSTQACATAAPPWPRLRDGERLEASSHRLWWWPFTPVHQVTLSGARRLQVVSRHPLTVLRLDEDALTVRDGEHVVRYTLTH